MFRRVKLNGVCQCLIVIGRDRYPTGANRTSWVTVFVLVGF